MHAGRVHSEVLFLFAPGIQRAFWEGFSYQIAELMSGCYRDFRRRIAEQ
jgi:hypothetical protein